MLQQCSQQMCTHCKQVQDLRSLYCELECWCFCSGLELQLGLLAITNIRGL